MRERFCLGLAWSVAAATAVPMLRVDQRFVRSLDFPRPQIALLGLAALAGLPPRHRAARWAAAAAVAWQAWRILPFTPLAPRQSRPPERSRTGLRILTSNVEMENRNSAAFLRRVEEYDPDVVAVLEADAWWESRLRVLEQGRPHVLRQPQDNYYGMLFYSRLPVREGGVRFRVAPDIPSIRVELELPGGETMDLYVVHPEPPPFNDTGERDAELMLVAREIRDRRRPAVLVGDLNDVAWSDVNRAFQKVSGMLDPRVGRGFYNTFSARSRLLRFPIDHAFHSRDFRLRDLQVLEGIGSDHFPVLLDLSYEPEVREEQRRPRDDAASEALADERIEKAKA